MPKVEIYTSPWCGYCARAKRLLDAKGVAYEEIDIMAEPRRRPEMEQRSGRHTVPQIFVDDQSLGGCDDIHALDKAGKLDALLGLGA
ncbi:glutaredoxin 3 [Oleisolibacter albus]|uniref:glutaredoxin 3 n=1 Tax=Oleisolibacter albus TaxID=2171757 RepID=UPI000DF18D2D|nr:glutaredoxin 3 [Oleisolibacter albus]